MAMDATVLKTREPPKFRFARGPRGVKPTNRAAEPRFVGYTPVASGRSLSGWKRWSLRRRSPEGEP
jgi:hypothetical protein